MLMCRAVIVSQPLYAAVRLRCGDQEDGLREGVSAWAVLFLRM